MGNRSSTLHNNTFSPGPGSQEVRYGDQVLTYTGEEFYTTVDGVKATLDKYGIAIIPSVLSEEECRQMDEGMWATAEHLTSSMDTPLSRADPTTYPALLRLKPRDGAGLFHGFGWRHAQYVWDVRSKEKIVTTFAKIFGTEDLIVSIDGAYCGLTPLWADGMYRGRHNLHCEQRYSRNDFELVQSWVTANPVKVGDGTLRILQGSHRFHGEFRKAFSTGRHLNTNWHVLTAEQVRWYEARGCADLCLLAPAGSHVLWDSRTVHCGQLALPRDTLPPSLRQEPRSPRNVVYVSMVPASWADEQCMKVRRLMFDGDSANTPIMSGHRPHQMKLFVTDPEVDFQVPRMPIPQLNDVAKKLAYR